MKIYIIHGWGGNPESDWYSWLKKELEKKGFEVFLPSMPDTMKPKIDTWVNFLRKQVGKANKDIYFIGHSIGCQTIMRYLEKLPDKDKIGGTIFVAGWFNLTEETYGDEGFTRDIAFPWINTSINFEKIKKHTTKFIDIVSDNDPYVPLSDSEIFKEKLGAKIIIEHGKGHLSGEDGIKEFPLLLKEILEVTK